MESLTVSGAEVVRGQGRFPADGVAHGLDVLAQILPRPFSVAAPRLLTAPGAFADQPGAQVHLEEGEAHLLPAFELLGEDLGVLALVGIAVDADLVAVLGADQPPGRHAVDLAGDIVQRHIDRAVAAAHALLVGEVANAVERRFDGERVPAHQVRLEHQRGAFAAGVAHLAEPVDALVGIDADDRVVVVGGHQHRTHVGDLELARRRVFLFFSPPGPPPPPPFFFEPPRRPPPQKMERENFFCSF